MKIKLTKDIFTKLVEAGFKEGQEIDFSITEPKKQKEKPLPPFDKSEAPKPGEHPPPPVNP